MSRGYTYSTISARAGELARIGVSFYLDDAAMIILYGQDGDRPQLSISHGEVEVTFLTPHGQVTEQDARIARELAGKADAYAAEVERLHTQHTTQDATGTAA
jgi:hypothetical protein